VPLELELISNHQEYDAQLERYISTGNVTAKLAGGRLQADRIEFDPATRTIFATGSVRFQRGQQFFQASGLRYSLLEGTGEMDDVYGVLDLDGSAQDLNLEMPPSAPLPPPEPFSCPPSLPPIPDWHPYPWAITGWAGQMTTANFGETFSFQGDFRPEYLMGVGVQRRLIDGDTGRPARREGRTTRRCPSRTLPPKPLVKAPWASACACGFGPGSTSSLKRG